ncbi:serine/threonine protein kinase [Candidatus Poribacteria bacterium]|nr:serine/threonine protein kinase [Candidatus Poribacteria bacterium]
MSSKNKTNSTKSVVTFASRGRIGMINPDGTGERYLDFDVPNQVMWQFGPQFSDGRRIILHSYEDAKTWRGNVQSHIWIYDLHSKNITEIATKNRLAPFVGCPVILPGEERIVANPIIDGEQRVFTMNLDGTDQQEVTHRGDGFAYGVTLSPDGTRLAFHITPYNIWTVDLDGKNRVIVASQTNHLYFGPVWSPDGQWLAYQDCYPPTDPGHDWADLCIGRPDGSEHRVVTEGRRQWFGTSYGSPETRGGGSNVTQWAPDGFDTASPTQPKGSWLTYSRALPNSQTAWQYQPQRPDTDHFNRDYIPEEARGGTEICLLNPFTGEIKQLTKNEPPLWDFRTQWSSDGSKILFSRVATGCPCEVWVMDAGGSNQRFLTRGYDDMGADFGRWLILQR